MSASQTVSFKNKAAYTLGGLGKDLCYYLLSGYFIIFALNVPGLSPWFILILFAAGKAGSCLFDLWWGSYLDGKADRAGVYRRAITLGAGGSALCAVLLFATPHLGTLDYVYYAAVYALFSLCYCLMDVPYWSLIPSFGSNASLRDAMCALPRIGTFSGWLSATFLAVLYSSNRDWAFLGPGLSLAVTCAVLLLLAIGFMQKCLSLNIAPCLNHTGPKDPPLFALRHNDALRLTALIAVLQCLGTMFLSVSLTVFASEDPGFSTILFACGNLTMLLAFVVYPMAAKLITRRTLFILSSVLMASSIFFLLWCSPRVSLDKSLMCAFHSCYCLGLGFNAVLLTVMLCDCIDYGEFKLGRRDTAFSFAVQSAAMQLGCAAAVLLCGVSAGLLVAIPDPWGKELNFKAQAAISCVLIVLMALIYIKYYKLNGSFFKNTLTALENLRGAESADDSPVVVRYALQKELVLFKLDQKEQVKEPSDVIRAMCKALASYGFISSAEEYSRQIQRKTEDSPCGIAMGIAIPHAKSDLVIRPAIAAATLVKPIYCGAPDLRPCDLFFLIASPPDGYTHLSLLGRLSLMLNEPGFPDKLRNSSSCEEIYERLIQTSMSICKHRSTEDKA